MAAAAEDEEATSAVDEEEEDEDEDEEEEEEEASDDDGGSGYGSSSGSEADDEDSGGEDGDEGAAPGPGLSEHESRVRAVAGGLRSACGARDGTEALAAELAELCSEWEEATGADPRTAVEALRRALDESVDGMVAGMAV